MADASVQPVASDTTKSERETLSYSPSSTSHRPVRWMFALHLIATAVVLLSIVGFVFLASLPANAQGADDEATAIMAPGDAIITQFSGTRTDKDLSENEHPLDRTFIDPDGASARVLHLGDLTTPPRGQVSDIDRGLELKASDIGQVFGVTLVNRDDDDAPPDAYLAATSMHGLHIVSDDDDGKAQRLIHGGSGARWQEGLFGIKKGGTPGSIWKVDGLTGDVSLFANVMHNGKPNSGAALGALAHDPISGSLYVSDLETGLIHRFTPDGTQRDSFDHGTIGRAAVELDATPYDDTRRIDLTSEDFDAEDVSTWGYAPVERRVFGLAIQGGRLYYAVAEGPTIWSVALDDDGSFGDDPRVETDIADATPDTDITSMIFDAAGDLYLAQRGEARPSYDYAEPALSQTAPVLRYAWSKEDGAWTARTDEYPVGLGTPHRANDGGVALNYGFDERGRIDLEACRRTVWVTGSKLRNGDDLMFVSSGGARTVDGLQGMYLDKVRPENLPPREAWYVDTDGRDSNDDGLARMGAVAIYSPCTPAETLPPGDIDPPPAYTPPVDNPGIIIAKRCEASAIGGNVTCEITATNQSLAPLEDDLRIDDLTTIIAGPDAGEAVPVIAFDVPDPEISCADVPVEEFFCTIPASLLGPGLSVTFSVEVETADLILAGNGGVRNCASFDHPLGVGNACAESGTEIVVEKIGPGICMPNATCKFGLSLSNIGLEPYAGMVILADQMTVGGGVSNAPVTAVNPPIPCVAGDTNQLPFTCLTPLALAPGETRIHWIEVTMPAPGGYVAENCFGALDAGLFPVGPFPPPGPGMGAGNPSCVDVVVPEPKPNLSVSKTATGNGKCSKVGANLECDYEIGITNENDVAFVAPIAFNETVPAGATLQPLGAPFFCAVGPPNYTCNSAGNVAIAPGDTLTIPARISIPVAASEALGCKVPNKVALTVPPGGVAPNIDAADDDADAEAWTFGLSWVDPITGVTFVMCDPTNLRVEKTSKGDCAKSGNVHKCGYDVTITNMGPDPYQGPVRLDDIFAVNPTSATFNGDFNCSPAGGGAFKCETGIVTLAKGDKLTIDVMAEIEDGAACRLQNTAKLTFPVAGSRGNGDASDDEASATARIKSRRCERPSTSIPPPPVTLCPDGLPIGRTGRCPCPRGDVWSASLDRCIDDQPRCIDPERRRPDGTCCPRGSTFDRKTGRCFSEPPVFRCPDPSRRKVDGSCCPLGTFVSRSGWQCRTIGDRCPPGQSWSRVTKRCLPDRPDCRRGEHYDRRTKRCVPDSKEPQCPSGQIKRSDGSCTCPRGTDWDRKTRTCVDNAGGPTIVPPPGGRRPCRKGEIRIGRRCVKKPDSGVKPCKRGEVRIGKRCVSRPDAEPKPCKRGQIRIGRRCVSKPDSDPRRCKRGQIRRGGRCITPPDSRPVVCKRGERRVGRRCQKINQVRPCPAGMERRRGRCRNVRKPPRLDRPKIRRPKVRPPKIRRPNIRRPNNRRPGLRRPRRDKNLRLPRGFGGGKRRGGNKPFGGGGGIRF